MTGTLLLAPIPQTAGPVSRTTVKPYRPPRAIGMTAAGLLNDSTDLGNAFRKWLCNRPATKRKAAEYLRMLK